MGFAVPLATWFRGPLRERVRQTILGSLLEETGMFNTGFLREIVGQHETGRRDYSVAIWSLMMLEAFLRQVHQVDMRSLSEVKTGQTSLT